MKVAITGATGLIGRALASDLVADGHSVVAITRSGTRTSAQQTSAADSSTNSTGNAAGNSTVVVTWDPTAGRIDNVAQLEGVDAVVHLAGETVAGRWTAKRKALLKSSRVDSTQLLVNSILNLNSKPRTYVGASAIGYYGDRGDEELTEQSSAGQEFLSEVCVEWEQAAQTLFDDAAAGMSDAAASGGAAGTGIAVSYARFGLVLAPQSTATKRLVRLGKLGLLGPLGNGRQWWSWITLHDTVRALRFLIETSTANQQPGSSQPAGQEPGGQQSVGQQASLTGPVNMCAPDPRRQREFVKVLAAGLRRPSFMPTPAFALKAALGGMGKALLLDSARVLPTKLQEAGFVFEHASLEDAVNWLTSAS